MGTLLGQRIEDLRYGSAVFVDSPQKNSEVIGCILFLEVTVSLTASFQK
jgi:hypothetical protein